MYAWLYRPEGLLVPQGRLEADAMFYDGSQTGEGAVLSEEVLLKVRVTYTNEKLVAHVLVREVVTAGGAEKLTISGSLRGAGHIVAHGFARLLGEGAEGSASRGSVLLLCD